MIQLRSECLMFSLPGGGKVPCSVEEVTVELIGEATQGLDPDIVQNASSAVLHYFREELGKDCVSVGEFASALARVLRGLGLTVSEPEILRENSEPAPTHLDLRNLAAASGAGHELAFFRLLKLEVQARLGRNSSCPILRVRGLRGCVKQILGARRWSFKCQSLSDEIVGYVRECLSQLATTPNLALDLR